MGRIAGRRPLTPSPPPSPTGQGGPLPAIDGQGLLSLNARRLGELFEGPMRQARLQHEGEAWAIGVDDEGDGPEADLTGASAAPGESSEYDRDKRCIIICKEK